MHWSWSLRKAGRWEGAVGGHVLRRGSELVEAEGSAQKADKVLRSPRKSGKAVRLKGAETESTVP